MNAPLPPKLTNDQLKRLRVWLVSHGIYPSLNQAKKATETPRSCKHIFLRYCYRTPNDCRDIADLFEFFFPKRKRGKQKAPTLQLYPVRLPVEMIEKLQALDGTVSEHIRQAISHYLNEE
jgi:hypothetical protein